MYGHKISSDGTRESSIVPSFLITIDTEGDNLWSRPTNITTRNARYLPRFQELCERHGYKPTYLVTHEMATCPDFREFGREVLKRKAGEIGMHLHAWNSPPIVPQTSDDFRHQPYLIEYPPAVMRDKVVALTELLTEAFDSRPESHRAGRWGFDNRYARILVDCGFRVDCSVTPHVSWRHAPGDPNGSGGCNYVQFPNDAYFLDLNDVGRAGSSPLLELPVTIRSARSRPGTAFISRWLEKAPGRMLHRAANRFVPRVNWLRPNGRNLQSMLQILKDAASEKRSYVQFMLHSSELMAGGSPTFSSSRGIESLYAQMQELFEAASRLYRGRTLREFYDDFGRRSN